MAKGKFFLFRACMLLMLVGYALASSAWAATETIARSIPLSDLGVNKPIHLRGVDAQVKIPFGIRRDEEVTGARLHLRAHVSPALLPRLSQLNVRLNGSVVATLPLNDKSDETSIDQRLNIDPRLFTDYNELQLQLIGHYSTGCEDAMNSTLWVQVDPASALELQLEPLDIKGGLGLLPLPFFDPRDNRTLDLPFMFSGKPDLSTLHSAGILASWFGSLAGYRGARFPVMLDGVPKRHAVLFATNDHLPQQVALKPVTQPTVSIVSSPADETVKILVIQGRDEAQLRTAVLGLIYGHQLMSGRHAEVTSLQLPPPRKPYDAPAWLRTNRKVRFGELVDDPLALQVSGYQPQPITLEARIPPDLFTGFYKGVSVDLHYRSTAPRPQDNYSLSALINGRFVRSYHMQGNGLSGHVSRLDFPLLTPDRFAAQSNLHIPAFQLGTDNRLEFHFDFGYDKTTPCDDTRAKDVYAAIDPDSTIDLTGFPHYAPMPDLALFASAGFPFTRLADLSDTVVVLPQHYAVSDIQTLLFLLGRMGSWTGATADRFSLRLPSTLGTPDADLLLVGADLGLLGSDAGKAKVPLLLNATRRELRRAVGVGYHGSHPGAAAVTVVSSGTTGALIGYQSPFAKGRSVVAVTGSTPANLSDVVAALADPGRRSFIRDSVTLIDGKSVHSIDTGKTYAVGELRWWQHLWLYFSEHPLQLLLVAIGAGLAFALFCFWILRSIAAARAHH